MKTCVVDVDGVSLRVRRLGCSVVRLIGWLFVIWVVWCRWLFRLFLLLSGRVRLVFVFVCLEAWFVGW